MAKTIISVQIKGLHMQKDIKLRQHTQFNTTIFGNVLEPKRSVSSDDNDCQF